jgi:CCR4-NOT transcription complex subunit 1
MCRANLPRRNRALENQRKRRFVVQPSVLPLCLNSSSGVLTQLGIVLGIMFTQIAGFRFATPSEWRLVLFVSSFTGVAQFLVSYLIVETPTWLGIKNRHEEKQTASQRLWGIHINHISRKHSFTKI